MLANKNLSTCLPFSFSLTAHKLYPVRIRLVNIEGEIEWFTVAYVPVVKTLKEANAQERARVRRANVLQRVLYLVFRTAIAASHKGIEVPLGGGQTALAFLRVLLYICDQPEERAILCFKSGGTAHPCSCCTVATKDMVSSAGLSAEDRDVVQTLDKQLEAADIVHHGDDRRRQMVLESHESIHSAMPALASFAGLSTPPLLLYKMVGFDVLHVRFFAPFESDSSASDTSQLALPSRPPTLASNVSACLRVSLARVDFLLGFLQVLDAGVTKMLVRRLMRIFAFVCKGSKPKHKNRAALARAAFRRLGFLGRRSQARRVAPGYVTSWNGLQAGRACVCEAYVHLPVRMSVH